MKAVRLGMFGYILTCLTSIIILTESNWGFLDYTILVFFAFESLIIIINFLSNRESTKRAWESGEIKSRLKYVKKLLFNY